MRLGWVALPMLLATTACSPVQRYQEAARGLRFTLDRVRPELQLAFPLERSRIDLEVTLGVTNPSAVAFHLRGFEGLLSLQAEDGFKPLGQVRLARALDLPAGGSAELVVNLGFTYQDLAGNWPLLQAQLRGERPGAWELEGTLRGEAYGIPITVPVHTRRSFGAIP